VSALTESLNAFLPFQVSNLKKYSRLFVEILPSPTQKTMQIVEQGHHVNPFRFMAFGYSVYALIALSEPLVSGKFSFLDSLLKALLALVAYLVFCTVQYRILKDVSHTTRTFDNYLTMLAIVGGTSYLLYGAALIALAFNEIFGWFFIIGASIYVIAYALITAKRFWDISYGKIFLYSFLSSLASSIALVAIIIPVALILGL
jgi:hypothetical protein